MVDDGGNKRIGRLAIVGFWDRLQFNRDDPTSA
jgi:hypothetical protein